MKVICFGDSNTYGYDPRSIWDERYDAAHRWVDILAETCRLEIENQGQNGREIPTKSTCFPQDTDLLIIMLGTNDILQGNSPEHVAKRMGQFIDSLNIKKEHILLIAPPAFKLGAWVPDVDLIRASMQLAEFYKTLAQWKEICFIDASQWDISMAYDGIHFTEAGQRAFADKLCRILCMFENTRIGTR